MKDKYAQICVSEKEWIDNEINLFWLRDHFDVFTRARLLSLSSYRLLTLDGHGSHVFPEFVTYCQQANIIPLCLPPHLTDVLQLLDVGLFSPLSNAFKTRLYKWGEYGATQINKIKFLRMLEEARKEIYTAENIKAG